MRGEWVLRVRLPDSWRAVMEDIMREGGYSRPGELVKSWARERIFARSVSAYARAVPEIVSVLEAEGRHDVARALQEWAANRVRIPAPEATQVPPRGGRRKK